MDGVCKGTVRNGQPVCPIVLANFSHLPVKLTAYSPLAKVSSSSELQMFSLQGCLTVTNGRPQLEKIDHIKNINLSHLPEQYRSRYKSLLRENADVISRNNLNVGHCKSLPHKVRLRDPNRITAINQYRLPYHLKEVAIDYVKKLLQAGVVRKSTSIFNSPLMLVKKPHADPNKPLAEQYRLVHNYMDLNKNISPCSYC